MKRTLELRAETWPLARPFVTARGASVDARLVVAEIRQDGRVGRGEAVPLRRYRESIASALAVAEQQRAALEAGADRSALNDLLPAGAARNALDCALWDLSAKLAGRPVNELAGLPPSVARTSVYTLSLGTPEAMARQAADTPGYPVYKLKLGGAGDIERVAAVRAVVGRARLVADANESWSPELYRQFVPELRRLGIELLEQPFAAAHDAALSELAHPIPVCADESCHTRADLPQLAGRYEFVNIKLDKTGGLSEALQLAAAAEAQGFRIMVGCMVGTSLGMAPAHLVAQRAEYVDLDGPLMLRKDREPAMQYDHGRVPPPLPLLWG